MRASTQISGMIVLLLPHAMVSGQEIGRSGVPAAGLDLPVSVLVSGGQDPDARTERLDFYGVDARGGVVIFVIDRSQSMRGLDLLLAKRELLGTIERFSDDVAFGVLFFNAETLEKFPRSGKPVAADAGAKASARKFVEPVVGEGGTCAGAALLGALRMADRADAGPGVIFYVGDGMSNCGGEGTREEYALRVLSLVKRKNAMKHVIHTLTVADEDIAFARALARQNGGTHRAVE